MKENIFFRLKWEGNQLRSFLMKYKAKKIYEIYLLHFGINYLKIKIDWCWDTHKIYEWITMEISWMA